MSTAPAPVVIRNALTPAQCDELIRFHRAEQMARLWSVFGRFAGQRS